MASIALALALMLSVGGGTALAAEAAVPGDILYPIKVNVDEKVAAAFAISVEARANLEARLAEKRLREAAALEARAEASAEHRAEAKTRLIKHLEKTKNRVADLRREAKPEAAARVEANLKAALDAHVDTLHDLDVSVSFDSDHKVIVGGDASGILEINEGVREENELWIRDEKIETEGPPSPLEGDPGLMIESEEQIKVIVPSRINISF